MFTLPSLIGISNSWGSPKSRCGPFSDLHRHHKVSPRVSPLGFQSLSFSLKEYLCNHFASVTSLLQTNVTKINCASVPTCLRTLGLHRAQCLKSEDLRLKPGRTTDCQFTLGKLVRSHRLRTLIWETRWLVSKTGQDSWFLRFFLDLTQHLMERKNYVDLGPSLSVVTVRGGNRSCYTAEEANPCIWSVHFKSDHHIWTIQH